MLILNFSHPLTQAQLDAVQELTGQSVERVIEVNTDFDHFQPFVKQAQQLVGSVGLTPKQWQSARLLINLPSLNFIAALLLAELHGRMGYFPSVLRLRPIAGSTPPQFEAVEILNLQEVRETARNSR
jgi:hypothetical protein